MGGRNKTIVADGARMRFVRTLQNLMVFSLTSPTLLVVCVEVRLLGYLRGKLGFFVRVVLARSSNKGANANDFDAYRFFPCFGARQCAVGLPGHLFGDEV
jgi:hypothetical protein